MRFDKELIYGNEVAILRFDKAEAITIEHGDTGLQIDHFCVCGEFEKASLKESSNILTLPSIDLIGSPRIAHKGELKVSHKEEQVAEDIVFSVRPRVAVGLKGDEVIVVALGSPGLTVKQLGQLMLELGCTEAINVDGKGIGCIEYKGIQEDEVAEIKEEKKKKKPRQKKA